MSTQSIETPSEGYEFPESSHIDPTMNTPPPPPLPPPPCEVYGDSEFEDNDITDGVSEINKEDIPYDSSHITAETSRVSRVLRSSTAKQRSMQAGSPTLSQISTPDLRKRGRGKCEDEDTRPKKRGRKPTVDTEIKKFETIMGGLLEDFKSKAYGLESNKAENLGLHLQINSLKTNLKQAQQDQKQIEASLSSKIAQLQTENSKLRIKLEIAIDATKEDSRGYVKVSDSDIAAEWGRLSFNIRDLISQCATENPVNACDELETFMEDLGRHLSLSLCDVLNLRRAILRRVIWSKIMFSVFYGEEPIWYGEAGQMLTRLVSDEGLKHLNPSCLEMVSRMKFSAITNLKKKIQVDEEAEKLIKDMASFAGFSLDAFVPPLMMEDFRTMMKNLIEDAINLHTVMMNSKAIFLLQWLGDDDGKKFALYDSESMESKQSGIFADTTCRVEFVEAPALVKYGNADGEGFEFNMILCKSSVILEEQKARTALEDENLSTETSHDASSEDVGDIMGESSSGTEQ